MDCCRYVIMLRDIVGKNSELKEWYAQFRGQL